jgi:glycosyltransferase involved in cell wall biosynthesis
VSLVQVFIPTYNRATMVVDAINSILNQTFKDFEIIVLDNCSVDNTEQVIKDIMSIHSCVKYVRNTTNLGIMGNLNQIRSMVTSDYFCFLTDDDQYSTQFLNTAVSISNVHPDVMAVAMRCPTIKGGQEIGCTLDNWHEGYYEPGQGIVNCINGNHPIITNCLFSKEFSADFFFEPALGNSADGYILLKLFTQHAVYISQEVGGYWNLHDNSASNEQEWVEVLSRKIKTVAYYREWIQQSKFSKFYLLVKPVSAFSAINVIAKESKNSNDIDRAFNDSAITLLVSSYIPSVLARFSAQALNRFYKTSINSPL